MKINKGEFFSQHDLAHPFLHQYLRKIDAELAQKVREGGCLYCLVGVLHSATYRRKPRGGQKECLEERRHSFCCNRDGCRKRHTPPSVRFLGRRIYWGVVVVLISAAHHGISAKRMQILRESLGIDRRTLERWRQWWLASFVQSPFWRLARARFMPLLCEKTLPLSLGRAFHLARPGQLLQLLQFLSPLTTDSIPLERCC